jgi:hypothetical protein
MIHNNWISIAHRDSHNSWWATICNYSNTTYATNGAGTAFPSKAPERTPGFSGFVLLDLYFSVCCFVDRWLSFCGFSFCHCIICSSSIYGFFAIPLVSANLSYVLSLMTRSFILSFCYIVLNAHPHFSSATIYLYILLFVCLFSSWS